MSSNDSISKLVLKFQTEREKESLIELLRKLELMSDERMRTQFSLMSAQVNDVKDTLRRSNL